MKKILMFVLFVSFTASADAQTGMPQSLTCTEKAFNFSFSVGSNWKLSMPKMGPLEASGFQQDYYPAWPSKPILMLAKPSLSDATFPYVTLLTNPFQYSLFTPNLAKYASDGMKTGDLLFNSTVTKNVSYLMMYRVDNSTKP
jgi:hypothetical protein